ncbi:rod shape-determining protein MreC [bacterium]|jgi:rod shape-determining protein MreC|nr:rod shape-determining protein MreC [Verrucomicrobiota bacterium]MDA7633131.1 rod shape-determining protein MreC [bacterium]MDB4746190.1 rod shape-determining protein MreC [Verrucomicrobiota bacterium]
MLRRPKVVLILAVMGVGLLLVLLPSRLNDQLKQAVGWFYLPFVGAADGIEEIGHQSRAYITPRTSLLSEIDRLRKENQRLQVREFQLAELHRQNARLRKLVEWQVQQPWTLKLGKVVSDDPANWWRGVTLNIGEDEGIQVDDAVLTEQGLVGKVVSVSGGRSKVSLLGDPNCRVAAVIGDSGYGGIVTPIGQGAINRRIVELKHLSSEANLEPGVEVLTSGSGGVFPSGIPIGRLIDSQSYDFGLYSGARVRLRADLDRLDYVWIIVGAAPEGVEGE